LFETELLYLLFRPDASMAYILPTCRMPFRWSVETIVAFRVWLKKKSKMVFSCGSPFVKCMNLHCSICSGNVRLRELVLDFGFKPSLIRTRAETDFSRSD